MNKLLTPGQSYRVTEDITWRMMGYTDANMGAYQRINNTPIPQGVVVECMSVDYPINLRAAVNLSIEALYKGDVWLIDPKWLSPIPSIWGKPTLTTLFVFIEAESKLAIREGGLLTGWYWYRGLELNPSDADYSPMSALRGEFVTHALAKIDAEDYGIKQQLMAQELTQTMRLMPKYVRNHETPLALQSYWESIIWHDDRFWVIARGYQFREGHLLHGESSTSIGTHWQDAQSWITKMYGEPSPDQVQPLR